MNEKEKTIQNYMKSLGISRIEAESLYLDDQDDFIGEAGEEMQKKAKTMKSRYAQSDAPKKTVKREHKVDDVKLDILQTVAAALEAEYDMNVEIEKEVNLHFTLGDENFSIKLTRHRKKK